ncbi:MAG: hypothetical protein ACYDEY_16315 [Acidimicrobiales bacterium]
MHQITTIVELVAAILVVGAIAFGIVAQIWQYTGTDRSAVSSTGDPVWSGRLVAMSAVDVHSSPQQAMQLAAVAIGRAGGRDVAMLDSRTVVGWHREALSTGMWELAIVLSMNSDGSIRFLCCARPRWSRTLFDFGASRKYAKGLAVSVAELGREPVGR